MIDRDDTDRVGEALASIEATLESGIRDAPTAGPTAIRLRAPDGGELSSEDRERLVTRSAALGRWRQGPFPLAEGLVIGGQHGDDRRWAVIASELPEDLSACRVLDVGCHAGYDCFAFAQRGAASVVGCEWSDDIEQARFLEEEIYESGVDLHEIGWQELDPATHGTFDLVHCDRVLEREAHPMNLLGRLSRLTAPGGTLLLGSRTLAASALSEYASFAPSPESGSTAGWLPGRLALRWMVESSGFDVQGWLRVSPGRQNGGSPVHRYVRAVRVDRDPLVD